MSEATNITTNQPFVVRGAAKYVSILKRAATGARYAFVTNHPWVKNDGQRGYAVPVEMLGLSAGKDVWMRGIQVRCAEPACRAVFRAGDSDSGTHCPACMEAAGAENEILDRAAVPAEDGIADGV